MKKERETESKCVCWIVIEVWRKTWDMSKKAKISSALLKLDPFANQLAGVIDLDERPRSTSLQRDVLRANASDGIAVPMEELVRSTIRNASTTQNLQLVEKNEQMTREQAKVLVAFRTTSSDVRGGYSLPILVVQGRPCYLCFCFPFYSLLKSGV